MIDFFTNKQPESGAGEGPRQQVIGIVISNIFWMIDRENDVVENLFSSKI